MQGGILGGRTDDTRADPTPALPFGHGLNYTSFEHAALTVDAEAAAEAGFSAQVTVRNVGGRAGTDVVQLYGRDVVASVTRPAAQLLGYARLELAAGEQRTVTFAVPATRLAFTGRDGRRIVEPGRIELWVGPSCSEAETRASVTLTGEVHEIGPADPLLTVVTIAG